MACVVMIAYGWMKLKSGDQMPIICDAHKPSTQASKLLSSLFLADSRQDLSLYVKRLTSGIRLFEPPLCIRLSPCGQKSKTPPPPQMRALVARLVNYAILLHEKRRLQRDELSRHRKSRLCTKYLCQNHDVPRVSMYIIIVCTLPSNEHRAIYEQNHKYFHTKPSTFISSLSKF